MMNKQIFTAQAAFARRYYVELLSESRYRSPQFCALRIGSSLFGGTAQVRFESMDFVHDNACDEFDGVSIYAEGGEGGGEGEAGEEGGVGKGPSG